MSKTFPTEKDDIINRLDDEYELTLSDEEYDRVRQLSTAQLFMVVMLMARAEKRANERRDDS